MQRELRFFKKRQKPMEYYIYDPNKKRLVTECGIATKYPIKDAVRIAAVENIVGAIFLVDKEQVDELKQQITNYKTDNDDSNS